MKAKKCDRCGKYYVENSISKDKFDIVCLVDGKRSIAIKKISETIRVDGNYKSEENYDLCDECMKSFENWLESCEREGIKNDEF